jgi:hypothetical protein
VHAITSFPPSPTYFYASSSPLSPTRQIVRKPPERLVKNRHLK